MGFNRSSLYGESILTSFRTIEGKVPLLDSHLSRFFGSVNAYYFNGRLTQKEFYDYYLPNSLNLDKNPNHYFRLTFDAASNPLTMSGIGISEGRLEVITAPVEYSSDSQKLVSSPSPFTKDAWEHKAGSYFESLWARKQAMSRGADDVLFYLDSKELLEASTSRLILKENNKFKTPALSRSFQSVGLKLFEKFLNNQGQNLSFEKISLSDLGNFESAYLVNSVKLLRPVLSIDQATFSLDHKTLDQFNQEIGLS